MFYRYELYIDDEPHDVGIFQGSCELSIDEDVDYVITKHLEELPIPDFYRNNPHTKTKAYFTKKGLDKFIGIIKFYKKEFEYQGLFNIKEIVKDFTKEDIVYEDEYQILVKA